MTQRRHSLLAFDPAEGEQPGRGGARARGRILIIMVVILGAYGYLAAGLINLSLSGTEMQRPERRAEMIEPPRTRAEILDRHGNVLATNLRVWTLYVDPHIRLNVTEAIDKLTRLFPDLAPAELRKKLTLGQHAPLRYQLSAREAQLVHELGLPALYVRKDWARIYPSGTAFPHVLGAVNRDGKGSAGVEAFFDAKLRPTEATEPLRLAVDLRAQVAARNVLLDWFPKLTPNSASVLVMDMHTGEVHVLVSLPDFDGNNPPPLPGAGQSPEKSPHFNHATQGVYELGSTFKTFTWAMALHHKVVNLNSHFNTAVPVTWGGQTFAEPFSSSSNMALDTGLIKSSNRMSVHLARLTGAERQRSFLQSLGLLERSQIELPEQSRPLLPPIPPRQTIWTDQSAANISFGHGLAISPLQLAVGYAALVNGGYRVTPTLLANPAPQSRPQVISPELSMTLRTILRDTVTEGTGRKAALISYQVGGKTGTANKPDPTGGYHDDKVLASLAAFFPTSAPRFVVVLTLDEPSDMTQVPKYQRTAGTTAVPVTAALIERIAPILGVMPDNLAIPTDAAPDKRN